MQQALRVQTTILPGGRIEISDSDFAAGEEVEVIVLFPGREAAKRSVVDVLESSPGHHLFKSAEEVDAYLQEERDAWE